MVYIRGHALDFERWSTKHNLKTWSYENVLPYFKLSQTHELGGDAFRGDTGPLFTSRGKQNHPLDHAFIEAGVQTGYGHTEDCNGFK